MTSVLHIDIETYSPVDLKKYGVYPYAAHPDFLILMASWSLNGGPVHREENLFDILAIPGLFDPEVVKVAHNAQFERVCLSHAAGLPVGQFLDPREWRDTLAIAAILGYPLGLEQLAKFLGGAQKDSAGTRLINIFCKPNRKKTRTLPEEKPEEWERFGAYCDQDVMTLMDVDEALGAAWPSLSEQEAWVTDQLINDRGVTIDQELAEMAVVAGSDNATRQTAEVIQLSGIDNPNSTQQMHTWLQSKGVHLPNLQAETVDELLRTDESMDKDVRRVLELRRELALVAHKKFATALESVSEDGRLRGQFKFFGAHTGRWSGRGVQLHNLARLSIHDAPALEAGLDRLRRTGIPEEVVQRRRGFVASKVDAVAVDAVITDLRCGLGAEAVTLKKLVRPMLLGPFVVADYSAIEARVLAWLAGEQWAIDAFNDGRDIYVETAERMSTPSNVLDRAQGKVAVLALGYNGGLNSLRAMGYEGPDGDGWDLVKVWRMANPKIVRMWQDLEDAFVKGRGTAGRIRVESKGTTRRVILPSGRAIQYHRVSHKTVPGPYGKPRRDITFAGRTFARESTYGGRLTENVTQAVARDILSEALVRLEGAGYPVVGHVHDEILVEATADHVARVSDIMCASPEWAEGLPIGAEGFHTYRYKKG